MLFGRSPLRLHRTQVAGHGGEYEEEGVPHKGDEDGAQRLSALHFAERTEQDAIAAESRIGEQQ
eukprot:scaffold142107_cov28-Tisochrysis_lutea.AAC.2